MSTFVVPSGNVTAMRDAIETLAQAGDEVILSAGTYAITGSAIKIPRAITLSGDGRGVNVTTASAINAFEIDLDIGGGIEQLHIRNFQVSGNRTGLGAGTSLDGFRLVSSGGLVLTRVVFERMRIIKCTNAINLDATNDACHSIRVVGSRMSSNALNGVRLFNVGLFEIEHSGIDNCGSAGFFASDCVQTLQISSLLCELNNQLLGALRGPDSHVYLNHCNGFIINGLHVRSMPSSATANKTGLCLSACVGGEVHSLNVEDTSFHVGSKAIDFINGCEQIGVGSVGHSFISKPFDGTADSGAVILGTLPIHFDIPIAGVRVAP